MEFTLLGAALGGMGALYVSIRWDAARSDVADWARDHWDRALSAAVAGVFVGRVVAMLLDGVNPFSGDIVIVRAGVNTVGATVAAIAMVAWLGRRQVDVALDGISGAALVGLAGWHGSCTLRDACLGSPSDLPWAFSQTPGGVGRHPVEIYAALLFLVGGVTLSIVRRRGRLRPFTAASLAMAVAGLTRLVTEPIRPSLRGGPIGWYIAAVVIGLIGALVAQRRVGAVASPSEAG